MAPTPPTALLSSFFVFGPANRRPASIIRRNVFADEEGEIIAQDPDPRNFLDVTATKDKQYILLNCNSKRRSGVSMLDARQPRTSPKPILEDADFTYFVEVRVTVFTLHA